MLNSMGFISLIIIVLIQILLVFFLISSFVAFNDFVYFFGVPINLIFIVLLNIVSLILLSKIYIRQEKRKVLAIENIHLEEFRSLVASVRSDRHDLNNHLTVISGLIKIGNFEVVNNYIKEMVGDIQFSNKALCIKSPILASMLFSKMDKYQRNKVALKLNIETEDLLQDITSTDFIRLLSNLLDNAYDAVLQITNGERNINLDMFEQNEKLFLVVKNSIQDEFNKDYFKIGCSTKSTKGDRGFGLAIIEKITKKYNGTMAVKSTDQLFIFEISFPKGRSD